VLQKAKQTFSRYIFFNDKMHKKLLMTHLGLKVVSKTPNKCSLLWEPKWHLLKAI